MRRKVSLCAILVLVGALVVLNHGCSRSVDGEEDEVLTFDWNTPRMVERLGEDDGYAFAVFYGADIHGSLETCG